MPLYLETKVRGRTFAVLAERTRDVHEVVGGRVRLFHSFESGATRYWYNEPALRRRVLALLVRKG